MLLIVELFQIFIFMVGLVGEKVGRKKIEKKEKKTRLLWLYVVLLAFLVMIC